MPRAKPGPMQHAPQVPQERKSSEVRDRTPAEYRAQMVELVHSGRSPESLENEFGGNRQA